MRIGQASADLTPKDQRTRAINTGPGPKERKRKLFQDSQPDAPLEEVPTTADQERQRVEELRVTVDYDNASEDSLAELAELAERGIPLPLKKRKAVKPPLFTADSFSDCNAHVTRKCDYWWCDAILLVNLFVVKTVIGQGQAILCEHCSAHVRERVNF